MRKARHRNRLSGRRCAGPPPRRKKVPSPRPADPARENAAPPTWRQVPAPLALVRADGEVDWNAAGREALAAALGDAQLVWRRWLLAAAARLAAGGAEAQLLAVPDGDRRIAVRAAAAGSDGALLLDLRVVDDRDRQAADLAATVSTLSHELRTPLAAAKSSLKLVLDGDSGPLSAPQERFLSMTMRNLGRLERLVTDLLDASQAETGHLHLHQGSVDLAPVLRDVAASFDGAARQAGVALQADGLPDAFPAWADADKIAQMLTNVVDNALKYTPRGGRVRLWVEEHAQPETELVRRLAAALGCDLRFYALVVEDNGPGIAPEDQLRVLEPFERGADTGVAGAGLGLHITRQLVEAHDGRLRLGGAPGSGTAVWLRLPRDPASAAFVRGARRLAAAWDQAPAGAGLAVARAAGPDDPRRRFVGERGDLVCGAAAALAADMLGVVVGDPAAWKAAWRDAAGSGQGWLWPAGLDKPTVRTDGPEPRTADRTG
jgi:signal transduction histidine kinase